MTPERGRGGGAESSRAEMERLALVAIIIFSAMVEAEDKQEEDRVDLKPCLFVSAPIVIVGLEY